MLQRHSKVAAFQRVGLGLALSGLLFILVATLYPIPRQAAESAATPLLCLVCGQEGGQDVVLNLLLFIPFAVGLRLLGWPWLRVFGVSALLSFTVEALQYLVVQSRDPSLSDLLTNSAGGALGATLAPILRDAVDPTPHRARMYFLWGAVFWLATQGLSAWLLAPWTAAGELGSRWANPLAGLDPFYGRVRSVRLDGIPMPPFAPVPDSAAVRARLNRGAATLHLEATTGRAATDRRWVYMVQAGSEPLLAIDQRGRDVYFSVPARALQFRLLPPTLRMRYGFPAESDQTIYLSAKESGRRMSLASTYGKVRRCFELNLSPSHGWSLLIPFGFALGPEARVFTAIWLASVFVPLGFWAGATGWGRFGWVPAAATLALGLGTLPAVSGYPPVHVSEWLAGVLGSTAGWALHGFARYLQTRCASPSSSESSSS